MPATAGGAGMPAAPYHVELDVGSAKQDLVSQTARSIPALLADQLAPDTTPCRATFGEGSGVAASTTMKTFEPFRVRDLVLRNRLVLAPMCMYAARDGMAGDFHVVHYGTRAVGGVGLVITEATGVLPNGRVSDRCLGLWQDEQVAPLRRVIAACHTGGARVAVQLAHAGRKCGAQGVRRVVAPSPLRLGDSPELRDPEPLGALEIETVVEAFGAAASRARDAGADAIEVHGAHGYLINQFLSPLANRRTDAYGGPTAGRARFLVEVLAAVRREWPPPRPLILRVSAEDLAPGGVTVEEMARIVDRVRPAVDLLHVSSGGILADEPPLRPGWQAPYAAALRRACGLPAIAVGGVGTVEQAEEILCAGQADLVAMGRALLRNPYLPLQAARQSHAAPIWPEAYGPAFA
jgi:NADPH2 dehydrogenase